LFSEKQFIDVSRKFVCVRIDSYESKEHQEWVRRFLDGRFENTAFCVLTPDGDYWLSRSGRSPRQAFGNGESTLAMAAIAKKYPVTFDQSKAVVQDFHSVRQALNVASADQRLLVLAVGSKEKLDKTRQTIQPVINQKNNLGRYHVDFETGKEWSKTITGAKSKEGLLFIAAGEFGLKGKVLRQLPLDASQEDISSALAQANKTFAATTKTKEYSTHVRKGHRLGIRFLRAVPYGEDRDADGEIDKKRGGRSSSRRRREYIMEGRAWLGSNPAMPSAPQ